MATRQPSKFDIAALQQALAGQFRGLDPKDPSVWPLLPRTVLCFAIMAALVVALWFVWLSSSDEELEREHAKELALREDYKKKLVEAVNLEALRKQREQVLQYVTQLEKQLPSKAEMDALLSDINQAGLSRGLQFELFRPGQVVVRDYYAELPITIRISGKYHDLGAFAADIANLSRIVTLHDMAIASGGAKGGTPVLAMDATARTYRYLDQNEVAAQKKAQAPKKAGAKP
jgi:type IV pilus assembly protein PilO